MQEAAGYLDSSGDTAGDDSGQHSGGRVPSQGTGRQGTGRQQGTRQGTLSQGVSQGYDTADVMPTEEQLPGLSTRRVAAKPRSGTERARRPVPFPLTAPSMLHCRSGRYRFGLGMLLVRIRSCSWTSTHPTDTL